MTDPIQQSITGIYEWLNSNKDVSYVKNAIRNCVSEDYFLKKRKLVEQVQKTRESLAEFSADYSRLTECIEEAKLAIDRDIKINKKKKKDSGNGKK